MLYQILPEDPTTQAWHDVDWKLVNCEIKRMRSRIFAAAKKRDYHTLRRLQKLLIRSKCNILYSVRRITMINSGKKTKGVDNLVYLDPKSRMKLVTELSRIDFKNWNPSPVRRIYIPKPNGKTRPLGIPTVKDRVIQMIIRNSLEPEWEAYFETSSYGFRPKRSVNDCIHRIFNALCKKNCRAWVVDADIKKCFDEISHQYLLEQISSFPYQTLISKWLKAGYLEFGKFHETQEGTPQGGVISPLLCNIALHGLESELGVNYREDAGRVLRHRSRLFLRYADDLLILARTKQDAELALNELKKNLSNRGLAISDEKTKIVHATEGFDFLGFNVRITVNSNSSGNWLASTKISDEEFHYVYNKTLLIIRPSDKSIKSFKQTISDVMYKYRGSSAGMLISKLNPIIRGWCQSKQAWHCTVTFKDLNNFLFHKIYRWARRRHPNKSYSWIKEKYFISLKTGWYNNNWVFSDPSNRNKIMWWPIWFRTYQYFMAASDACYDDATKRDYFSKLEKIRIESQPFGIYNNSKMALAKAQLGRCPVCCDDLFNGEPLHTHHIIERAQGGSNTNSNLLLLHAGCHYRITYGKDTEQWRENFIKYKRLHSKSSENDTGRSGSYQTARYQT